MFGKKKTLRHHFQKVREIDQYDQWLKTMGHSCDLALADDMTRSYADVILAVEHFI